jgi:acyl carrier protein
MTALTERQIRKKLEAIFCDRLGVKEANIAYDVTLTELGGDSLDLIKIVLDVENAFDIELLDAEIHTVGDLVSCVKKRVTVITGPLLEELKDIPSDDVSGAVQPKKNSCRVSATLTSEQRKMWEKLGGGDWLRRYLDATSKGRTTT